MRSRDRSSRMTVRGVVTAWTAVAIAIAPPLVTVTRADVPPGLTGTPDRPMQPQHAFKCQKLVNHGVASYLATWSKTYAKCIGGIAACVQTKASDPTCLTKAADACNASIPNLGDDTDKAAGTVLENLVTTFCRSLSPTELFDDVGGPRFSLITDACKNRFIQNLESCLFLEANCAAEQLLLVQMPRAHDLLVTAGVTMGHALDPQRSCLVDEGGAGALGSDPKAGKVLLGCQKSAAKAGVSFAAKARGAFAKCADAVMNCAQVKRTQKCVDGAAKTCTKQITTVDGAQTKLGGAITKACEKTPIDDLLGASGGDAGALATLCTGVGVVSVTNLADYATCVAKHERCQVEDSIRFTVPRIDEFSTVTLQPSPFGSTFCPAP
jgi:hypothetical protein